MHLTTKGLVGFCFKTRTFSTVPTIVSFVDPLEATVSLSGALALGGFDDAMVLIGMSTFFPQLC